MAHTENTLIRALQDAVRNPDDGNRALQFEDWVAESVNTGQFHALNEALDWAERRDTQRQCLLTAHANAVGDTRGVWVFFFPVFVACAGDTDYLEFTTTDIVPLKAPLEAEFLRTHLAAGDPHASFCIPQFLIRSAALTKLIDSQSATAFSCFFIDHIERIASGVDASASSASLFQDLAAFLPEHAPEQLPARREADTVVLQYLLPVVASPSSDTSASDFALLISSMEFSGDEDHPARMEAAVTALGLGLNQCMGLSKNSRVITYSPIRVWNAPAESDDIREALIEAAGAAAAKLGMAANGMSAAR